jgi:hypothetical protein
MSAMIRHFEKLQDDEVELMLKAPILVAVLVAGADGVIDKKEVSEVAHFLEKQTRIKSELAEYFREVAPDFEDKMNVVLQGYPRKASERNLVIVEDLAKLNAILPRIASEFATQFYHILKKIAQKTAASSGGLLGMNAIDENEAKYLELYMIENPTAKLQ